MKAVIIKLNGVTLASNNYSNGVAVINVFFLSKISEFIGGDLTINHSSQDCLLAKILQIKKAKNCKNRDK